MGAKQSKQDSGAALAVGAAVVAVGAAAVAVGASVAAVVPISISRGIALLAAVAVAAVALEDPTYKSSTSNKAMSSTKTSVKIMSYNVWSQENCVLITRMEAIGRLVEDHSPHFICFQEITPAIYNYFSQSSWWKHYTCSMSVEEANHKTLHFCILLSTFDSVNTIKVPLGYKSKVGREITIMETKVWGNKSLVVATSHLKSRCADPSVPNVQYQNKKERIDQAKEAVIVLKKCPNVIFCGDMNWDENVDGKFPLPEGWVDAWTELRPDQRGFTYDTRTNGMLSGHRPVRKRFDRFSCNLNSFELEEIEIIGKDAIPEVMYKSNPVLPSDHYGLILTIS